MSDLRTNDSEADFTVVRWLHTNDGYPILIYAELDKDRCEVRKVEVFRDGHMQFTPPDDEVNGTLLAWEPLPPIDEIAADPEFEPAMISKDEFEVVWGRAIAGLSCSPDE